jgi:hypothetical protein
VQLFRGAQTFERCNRSPANAADRLHTGADNPVPIITVQAPHCAMPQPK